LLGKIQSRSHSILGDFYTELEKNDSSNYVSGSLGVMQTSLDRYLKSKGYKVLIIRGREFGKSNKITFGTKARKNVQTQQMHLSGKKKKCCGKRADLSNGKSLVFADPTFTGSEKATTCVLNCSSLQRMKMATRMSRLQPETP